MHSVFVVINAMEAAVNTPRNKPDLLADEVLNLRKSLEQKG